MWATAFALAALAILPVASATTSLTLTASSLRSEGTVVTTGTLLAILMEDPSGAATATPSFTIEASSLHMETDTAEPVVHAGIVVVNPIKDVTYTSTPRDVVSAILRLVETREGHRVNIYGMAGTTLETHSGCAVLRPADSDLIRREALAYYTRTDMLVGTQAALALESCGRGNLTIRGDFLVSAWEADLELETNGTKERLETGQLQPSQPAPDARPFVSRDQEIYFTVHDATLTMPAGGRIYVQGPNVAVAGQSRIDDASGRLDLPTPVDLKSSQLELEGIFDVVASSRGAQRPFSIRAGGDLQSASADGQPLSITAVQLASWFNAVVLWILAVPVVLAVAWRIRPTAYYYWLARRGEPTGSTEPVTMRQRRGAGYWALAWNALHRARYNKARRSAKRAARLFPSSLDVQVLVGMIPHRVGAYDESLRAFASLHGNLPEGAEQAEVACLCAQAAMGSGRAADALKWLRQAARDHYATFQREASSAIYDALVADEWFAGVRDVARPNVVARVANDPAFS